MKKILCFFAIAGALLLSCNNKIDVSSGTSYEPVVTEAVDLGLSVKWAPYNIGATTPEGYGDYYAWGETQPHYSSLDPLTWKEGFSSGYDWKSYQWCNGTEKTLTKYCPKDKKEYWDGENENPDNLVTLQSSDDVAHVKLGGKWRMPTVDEINELLALKTNEDYTWEQGVMITDANDNEVKDAWDNVVRGIRITRNSTGATLFLPAAGYCYGTSFGKSAGSWGFYWSSSLGTGYPNYAYRLRFNSDDSEWYYNDRYYGLTVRPVSE